MEKDPTAKWGAKFIEGKSSGILAEFVPEGQSIEAWKEMFAHQIAFTKKSLRQYVDDWRGMLVGVDPKAEVIEGKLEDGSILVTYTSLAAKEMGQRRFIKAKDGIYMLAYHVRPELKDEKRVELWRTILKEAYLIRNPEKKR